MTGRFASSSIAAPPSMRATHEAVRASCSWRRRGRVGTTKILLAAGADPNLSSKTGNFPLLEASRYGSTEIVQALLAAGGDVQTRASNGWTALRAAEERGHTEIASLLRKAGASR